MPDAVRAVAVGAQPGPATTPKLSPPAAPAALLRRERLLDRLSRALDVRLTSAVAGAGYGKTTVLASFVAGRHCAWYGCSTDDASLAVLARGVVDALRLRVPGLPPDVAGALTATGGPGAEHDEPARARGVAALVSEALQAQLRRDLLLVLDDLQELNDATGALQLVESLCRQAPSRLHVVLASRAELPFPVERLRGQGQVLEITGSDLAFDVAETNELLAGLLGTEDAELAEELHRATGGWPAAVRLAVEALRGAAPEDRRAALERVRGSGGPLFAYLAAEVFANEPPEVGELIRTVAPLERFTPELCDWLGVGNSAEVLGSLARRGLFVELHGHTGAWYSLGEPVRDYALAELAADLARESRMSAARWFEEQGHVEEAIRCLTAAGELTETARLVAASGAEQLARGSVDVVLDAVSSIPPELRDSTIEQLAGEALQIRGRWDEALRCYERASEGAELRPAGLAWRMGLLLHLEGRVDEALETYEETTEEGVPRDVALLLAWRASARWLRSDVDRCRADATRAFEIASTSGDAQALAAAHTVLAMLAALEGDRAANDSHYLRALDYAQEAGDVLQLIRVRTNRGSRHLEEGAYDEAIAELDIALRLADVAGFASFRALALTNRGEARAKLGRFEEAVADLEDARELYQRLGSRMVSYPLDKLGEIYRVRGDLALARATYEEALSRSEPTGDMQGLVPALYGLARVLLHDDPERAEDLAARAVATGPGMGQANALLAAGWVALARGRHDDALAYAGDAAAAAGLRRDRAVLAESLELRALAADDPRREVGRLREATAIWRDLGNPLGEARAELAIALLEGDDTMAEAAETRLRALGARGHRAALAHLVPPEEGPAVAVQSLGRFRVSRAGEPVPLAAWQSRKARDLFKILLARRGHPAMRDYLMETLWPDQDPEPLGNRLSVLLSTVRAVLDPGKRFDPDHFVGADKNAVWLQSDNLTVDVDRFLAAASEALAASRIGADGARVRLVAAEALYSGDFLEEDVYEDWAIALREEARAAYIDVTRELAEGTAQDGDTGAASRYYLRILERDAYDEPAHLGLVATLEAGGRHGEARRCFRAYCARMDQIGVESASFPGATAAER
jgi:ATP/maltotriose-dependent transcriptional regulator MalT/DNA-binding SARP family transcriptional activator